MKTTMIHTRLPDTFFNTPSDWLPARLIEPFLSDNAFNTNTPDTQAGYAELKNQYCLRVAMLGLGKKDLKLSPEDRVRYLASEARKSSSGDLIAQLSTQFCIAC